MSENFNPSGPIESPHIHRFIVKYAHFLTRWYGVILFLAVAVTFASIPSTLFLFSHINTRLEALLPDDYPSVQAGREIQAKKISRQGINVAFEFERPEQGVPYLAEIASALQQSPYLSSVAYEREGFDFFKKNGLLYLSREKLENLHERMQREIHKRKLGGLFLDLSEDEEKDFNFQDLQEKYTIEIANFPSRYYENKEQTIYSFWLYSSIPNPDFQDMQRAYDDVRLRVESLPLVKEKQVKEVYYYGDFVRKISEYNTLNRDLSVAGIVSFVGITLFLLWQFRRFESLLFIFLPFFCALSWTFAVTHWLVGELNIVTSFLFSILFGSGVDFGIHLLSRYWEERRIIVDDNAHAISRLLSTAGKSCFIAGLTTAPAFFLLIFNQFKGFSEFGVIASIGIVLTVISYWLVMPCLLLAAEKIHLKPNIHWKQPHIRFLNIGWKKPRSVVMIFCVGFIASLFVCVPQLRFEYDFKKVQAHVKEVDKAQQKMRESTRGSGSPASILVQDTSDIPLLRDQVEEIIKREGTIASQFVSYDRFVPEEQPQKKKILRRIDQLLDDDALKLLKDDEKEKIDDFRNMLHPDTVTLKDLPPVVAESFFGNRDIPGQLVMIMPKSGVELDDGQNAMRFADEIRTLSVNGKTYHASSNAVIWGDVLRVILRDSKRVIPITFFAILLILWFDFRRVWRVLLVSSPLMMGLGLTLGIMCLLNMRLNLFNMVAFPMILGIGIDYGVHFYHRYHEGGKGTIPFAVNSTGTTIFVSAVTAMFGFLGLAFAKHAGLASLGMLSVLGIGTSFFAGLVFFPALLQYTEK